MKNDGRQSACGWLHRRAFLGRSAGGIGSLALASLLDPALLARRRRARRPAERRGRPGRWEGAVRPLHFPARVEADHLPVHGRRPVAPGDARLQADAGQDAGPADAGVVHQGHADRAASGRKAGVPGSAAHVQAVRSERPVLERDFPAPRHGRRRHLHHQLDGDRGDQPRPGSYVHEHGHDHFRAGRRWGRG